MQITHSIEEIPSLNPPIALTIGTFDGVHLGHKRLIDQLHLLTKEGGTKVAFTFKNHPYEALHPKTQIPRLCTIDHKIRLLEEYGIDLLVLLDFTEQFAEKSYRAFIEELRGKLPFAHLVLGKGAVLGNNQEGSEEKMHELGKELNFSVHYLEKRHTDGEIISSKRIRILIQAGKLDEASNLLGRPFSIYSSQKPDLIEKRRARFIFSELCQMPQGEYEAEVAGKPATFIVQSLKAPLEFELFTEEPINWDETPYEITIHKRIEHD